MFDKLIEIAMKKALENLEIKDQNKKNNIIDVDKDGYKVLR